MTMHTVTAIPIAANAMTRLNPDSYHLLITGAGPCTTARTSRCS